MGGTASFCHVLAAAGIILCLLAQLAQGVSYQIRFEKGAKQQVGEGRVRGVNSYQFPSSSPDARVDQADEATAHLCALRR
jgi:hypothetical protein